MLFENQQQPAVSIEDVEEVSNYVQASIYGLKCLNGGFLLSLPLLKEVHSVLLKGIRCSYKYSGEFRRT